MATTHTVTFRRLVGAGLRARSVTETITVPVLGEEEFASLLAAHTPTGRHGCGTAAGAPLDGLVRDEWRGRVWAARHIGHGVLMPVAVLAASLRADEDMDTDETPEQRGALCDVCGMRAYTHTEPRGWCVSGPATAYVCDVCADESDDRAE